MNLAKIIVENLRKSFGSKEVLKGVNFSVNANESFVIMGGSGSGKSVLIKCILGLLEPDQGSKVLIDGKDVTFLPIGKRKEINNKIGVLFQGGALFDSLPVWENISFKLLHVYKMAKSHAMEIAIEKLKLVELDQNICDQYTRELSGGMQKRVALARAIANDPEILFLDEPTGGLDPVTSRIISKLIITLAKQLKSTVITITHSIESACIIADRAAILSEGKFIWVGKKEELLHPTDPILTQFILGDNKNITLS